ncbi:PrsW family intramembrane metalloprotease [Clostridium botulinum]|uniref:Protease PrsW n=1 Tax=Clostridium botulinum TaxID=1491 RepID=A0A9Q1UXM0_CLOBO|nr:PrsW family glutamic-type intramembrane protease [Clostridium botulinum]AEB75020.1 membrane protein, putative [Clostridium botulinum BKT015925]KEI00809.1 peptidase [Clostridium botulinum C/D str. Sp77]KEI03596.1 peptidase [Clostridium botulinum D str. 16868]KLU74950.1 peptidase [Clostridium botulinum V891]KOA74008.1 peptidase [Clostridium botulinum]
MTTRLVVIAVIPGIVFSLLVYLTDRYDKEPIKVLIKVFIMGALAVIPTVFVEKILFSLFYFHGFSKVVFSSFIVAGLTEEFFKREVVMKTVFKKDVFNEKLDGIIYCIFSSLGFATIENIIYVVFKFSANYYVGLYRGIFSVPAHLLFGITMGYYMSLGKFSLKYKTQKTFMRKSLIVPTILHGIFDFILMAQKEFLAILFLPFVVYLWLMNLRKLNKYYLESKKDFEERTNRKNT